MVGSVGFRLFVVMNIYRSGEASAGFIDICIWASSTIALHWNKVINFLFVSHAKLFDNVIIENIFLDE